MSLQEVSLRSVSDGTIVKAYRRIVNDYGIDPDSNRQIVIGQRRSYEWLDGEGLNTDDGINFTSLSGAQYVLVK